MVPKRMLAGLLLVLAAAAGSLDAVCVTRLGGLFASVITGNLVQLGRAVATVDWRLIVAAVAAVGGYGLGVAAAGLALGRGSPGWRRRTGLVTAGELTLLVCVAVGWLATHGHPDADTTWPLLVLAAAAMGVQSAVTISSGVPGASTTYLTGTLTNLVRALASTPRKFADVAGDAGRLAALLCGAAAGALLLRVAPSWAPVLPVVLVGAVVAIMVTVTYSGRSAR